METRSFDAGERKRAADMLAIADAIDIQPVVRKFVNERRASAVRADAIAQELRKYLVLCALDGSRGYILSGEVDVMWHTFILFTRRYEDFCAQVAGRMLHHIPGEDMAAYYEGEKQVPPRYADTLVAYERVFGEAPDCSIWPDLAERAQDPFPCEGGGGSGPQACGPPKDPGGPGNPGGPF